MIIFTPFIDALFILSLFILLRFFSWSNKTSLHWKHQVKDLHGLTSDFHVDCSYHSTWKIWLFLLCNVLIDNNNLHPFTYFSWMIKWFNGKCKYKQLNAVFSAWSSENTKPAYVGLQIRFTNHKTCTVKVL